MSHWKSQLEKGASGNEGRKNGATKKFLLLVNARKAASKLPSSQASNNEHT